MQRSPARSCFNLIYLFQSCTLVSFFGTIPNFANEKEPKRNFLFSSMKPNFWNYKISFNHGRVWVEWKSLLIWLWSSWITWIAFNPRKVRVVRMSWLDRGLVERKLSCCLFFTFESFHLSIGSDCKNICCKYLHICECVCSRVIQWYIFLTENSNF